MANQEINVERFYHRYERIQTDWMTHKTSGWSSCDAICIPLGAASDDATYSKASSLFIYLLGYEFPDTVIVITRNNFYFMSSPKKCEYLNNLVGKNASITVHLLHKTKDDGINREHFNQLVGAIKKGGGKKLGGIFKQEIIGNFIPMWFEFLQNNQIEQIDISPAIGLHLSVKDEFEMEFSKRAAILSNKVMKHGFITEMESILDNDVKITHEEFADKIEAIILDPTKIGVKLSADSVDICYAPIIQSGGKYDIKPSATSNSDELSANVILCSLGARYKGYCATLSRTFLVDAPLKVETSYGILLSMFNHCLEKMIVGNALKEVMDAAKDFLKKKDESLLNYLPKSLGFAIGIELRDSTMLLNATNQNKFTPGMVFNLSVGFNNIPLSAEEKAKAPEAVQKLDVFSLLIADCLVIMPNGDMPEILTKSSKEFSDISYNIGEKDGDEVEIIEDDAQGMEEVNGVRRSMRAREEKEANENAASTRVQRQKEIMEKKLEEARKRLSSGNIDNQIEDVQVEAKDLVTYRSRNEFPRDTIPNRLKVDLEKEALLVPIHGLLVPFHISTIKSMTSPDPDMRINFFVQGNTNREAIKNMQQLVIKYGPTMVFIKELTFRSLDGRNLTTVYQQFQELRRRVRLRQQEAENQKDIVPQIKLVRIKDQRVPRLQEVTMRPTISGRKSVGTLEAHQNGLRFSSSKGEILDVMYGNIKHAIYQPCDKTSMVLIHFNLKNPIIINKKKQWNVQFYTEVIESSLNLEGARRSSYDPDELDDEQREREMKKRLNIAFGDFCTKVVKVAEHYDQSLSIDKPYKKFFFEGNPYKEMVLLRTTPSCLINLTEVPPFIITLSEVEHAHFERVTYATKNVDLTFIFKNWDTPPRTITAIDMKYIDQIQDWLNFLEITCTKGPKSINWTEIMKIVKESRDTFYLDRDEDGEKKPAGWSLLSAESDGEEGDGEEEDEESSYGDEASGNDESDDDEEEEEEEDEDDESDFDDDDEDDDDDEEGDEEGQSWEELEREAKIADRTKRAHEEEQEQLQANSKRTKKR